MSTTTNDISGRIKYAREKAQLEPAAVREQLAERGIQLSKAGLHRLENTEPTNPNLRLIEAVAEITNVAPGWILFGKGPTLQPEAAGWAIRGRIIDTIELMAGALDLTARQQGTFEKWIDSVRATRPKKIERP
ncbi:MAG: hypothetical protein K0U93_19975 [Gammaproteobacteria bacterium]|nr:hypothetical protein [Gammaproteobacteria bacterium]